VGTDLTKVVLIPVEHCISIVYAKHDTLEPAAFPKLARGEFAGMETAAQANLTLA
jgi:hypothetical protein